MGNLIFAIIIAVIIINSAKRAKGKGSGTSGDSGRRRPAGDTGPLFKGTPQAAETVRKKKTYRRNSCVARSDAFCRLLREAFSWQQYFLPLRRKYCLPP